MCCAKNRYHLRKQEGEGSTQLFACKPHHQRHTGPAGVVRPEAPRTSKQITFIYAPPPPARRPRFGDAAAKDQRLVLR